MWVRHMVPAPPPTTTAQPANCTRERTAGQLSLHYHRITSTMLCLCTETAIPALLSSVTSDSVQRSLRQRHLSLLQLEKKLEGTTWLAQGAKQGELVPQHLPGRPVGCSVKAQ